MAQQQQQQQQQPAPRPGRVRYAFQRSTWITAIWNWFLMLAGKAAEPVLTISVIYSCARLLPAIHMPVQLDNTIFICQMIALDIGGLGLRKLANQARKDNNEEGAALAGRVSTALLTIMGVNVALSVLESIAPLDPNFVKVTEGILLIARAVMAVLYAFVIHSLHSEGEPDGGQPHIDPPFQPISPEDLQRALAEQQAMINQQLQALQTPLDTQAIIAGVMGQIDARFTTAMKHLAAEVEQRVRVSLASQSGTNSSVSPAQSGTLAGVPKLVPLPQRSAPGGTMKRPAVSPAPGGTSEVVDYKAVLYPLLDEDNTRQVADLVQITGYPKTTVWRWFNRYHAERGTRGQNANAGDDGSQAPESETA